MAKEGLYSCAVVAVSNSQRLIIRHVISTLQLFVYYGQPAICFVNRMSGRDLTKAFACSQSTCLDHVPSAHPSARPLSPAVQVTERLHAIESLLQALEPLFKPPQKALPLISVDLFGKALQLKQERAISIVFNNFRIVDADSQGAPIFAKPAGQTLGGCVGRPPARKHAGSTFCKAQESTKVITAVRNLSVYIVGVGFSGDRRPVVAVETIGINEELVDILLASIMQPGTVEELPDRGVD